MASYKAILLRGLSREARHWLDFPTRLEESSSLIKQVICLDLPGFGRANHFKAPLSIKDTVAYLEDQLTKLAVGGPLILIGISLGAMVAHCWSHHHPQRFAALILINPSLKGINPFYKRVLPSALWTLIRAILMKDIHKRETLIFKLVTSHPDISESVFQQWFNIQKTRPIAKIQLLRQIIAAATYKPCLQWHGAKTLVINASQDKLVSPTCSEAIAKFYSFELATHPSAGHDLPIDDSEWLLTTILKWLEGWQHASNNA